MASVAKSVFNPIDTAISMGHSSSAYSRDWVMPRGRVIASATMIACHPQKWIRPRRSLNILAFSRRCSE